MSRSKRKHPIVKICGRSDKMDKRIANKKFRKHSKIKLKSGQLLPIYVREVSDTWNFSSDGLAYYMDKPKFVNNPNYTEEVYHKLYRK